MHMCIISDIKRTKFELESKKFNYLGHSSYSKAFWLWDPQIISFSFLETIIFRVFVKQLKDYSKKFHGRFQLLPLLYPSHLFPNLLFEPLKAHSLFQPSSLKNLIIHVNFHNDFNKHIVINIFLILIFINMQPPHLHHSQEPTSSCQLSQWLQQTYCY